MKLRLLCLTLATLAAVVCNDGPASPTTISSGNSAAATVDVAGVWTGQATDSAGQMTMTWRLTQSSRNVTGTFAATTPIGAPIYTAGAIAGTTSASTMGFTITIPRGSIVDAPDCSATFTGTADDVQTDSMAGTYSGSDSCGGTFVGGRFTLLKE